MTNTVQTLLVSFIVGFNSLNAQNYIDNYLSGGLTYSTIANSTDGISNPTDLDFKPNSNELWVAVNGNTLSAGVIIYNAGMPNQSSQKRQDSHTGHFFNKCAAIAFSDIGEWANADDDGTISTPTFMGPSLWSSDTAIYARVFQSGMAGAPLGSHLSMLHQSPFAMGIAHETARTYWLFDGFYGNLCKYDFGIHHGPGYEDHSTGKIWRYSFVSVMRVPGIPSHMVVDKVNNWLYFIDGANKTLKRLKTTSGIVSNTLTPPSASYEILAGYYQMAGALVETIETFSSQPCGVDYYNDRLVVSDHTNGNITIYNTSGTSLVKMGTVVTGQPGIMGIKIGTDGKIWYVNNTNNTVVRITPAPSLNDAGIESIDSPSLYNHEVNYYSSYFNQCTPTIIPKVKLINNGVNPLLSVNINYKVDNGAVTTFSWTGNLAPAGNATITLPPINSGTSGPHKLTVYTSIPNSTTDSNPANDKKDGAYRTINVVSYPFFQGFTASTFPPPGFDIVDYNKYCYIQRDPVIGGFAASTGCMKLNYYSTNWPTDKSGQIDHMMLPSIDLTNAPATAALEFNYAYAQCVSFNSQGLDVLISTDCGKTWTNIYSKSGSLLATTVPYPSSAFVPSTLEWKKEVVSLSSFIGQPVMIQFVCSNGAFNVGTGNNIYIDDINIDTPLEVADDAKESLISVHPNPTSGQLNIVGSISNSEIGVYSILGEEIVKIKNGTSNKTELDITGASSGVYFLKIDGRTVKKVIVTK